MKSCDDPEKLMMSIIELMILVFLINFPFGYWRFNTARFSRQWMMAIHIPVPFVIILRIFSGFGWKIVPFFDLRCRAIRRWKV